ncbi:unnamed protein product [Ixodes persulcatus]
MLIGISFFSAVFPPLLFCKGLPFSAARRVESAAVAETSFVAFRASRTQNDVPAFPSRLDAERRLGISTPPPVPMTPHRRAVERYKKLSPSSSSPTQLSVTWHAQSSISNFPSASLGFITLFLHARYLQCVHIYTYSTLHKHNSSSPKCPLEVSANCYFAPPRNYCPRGKPFRRRRRRRRHPKDAP